MKHEDITVSIPNNEGALDFVHELNTLIRDTFKMQTGIQTCFGFEFHDYSETQHLLKLKRGFLMRPRLPFMGTSRVEALQNFLNIFLKEDRKMEIHGFDFENGKEIFFLLSMQGGKWWIEEAAAATAH